MPSHNLCHPRRPTWRSWLLGCWLRPNVCACSAMPSSTGEHAARGGVTEREGVCTWRNSKGSLLFCRSEFMAMFSSCYLISLPQFRLHQLSKELPRKSPTYYSRSGVSGRAAHTRTMLHRRSAHWIKIQSHMYIYMIFPNLESILPKRTFKCPRLTCILSPRHSRQPRGRIVRTSVVSRTQWGGRQGWKQMDTMRCVIECGTMRANR